MKKYFYIILIIGTVLYGKTFENIEFTGDVDRITGEFDRATLLKICHVEYPAIYKVWKRDPVFKTSQIDGFVDNLKDYSNSMGYYKVEVTSRTDDDTIYLNIKKNKAIMVNSVNMNEEFSRFAKFQKGERFKTTDFSESKKKIMRHLEENGYPTYKMNAKALVDIDLYKVDINMSIDKGKKRYFATTEVNNSSKVTEELILDEIMYKEGEVYDVRQIEESYDNLYRFGVFEKIKMEADFNHTEGKSPLILSLEEGKTKEFLSSIGYDTEEGARGGIEYIDHNFFGDLREFRTGFKISQMGYRAYTNFYDPLIHVPILDNITFRNELSYSDWDYDAYVEKLLTERVTFGKSYGRAFSKSSIGLDHFVGFQIEQSEIESGIPDFLAGNYLINSLFYRFIVDGRDDEMDAKNGYYGSLYVEKSMKQLGSDIDYLKILAEARYIKQLDPMVLAFKVKAGTISDKTPPFKHFFLGGAMSNRGHEYRDLGPHVGDYPLGGLTILDASFESRYYLSENFATVGFVDASKLSEEINDFSGEWYLSYGLGLRYLSVIGPLRLDIGIPDDGGFALHLGIGQVF